MQHKFWPMAILALIGCSKITPTSGVWVLGEYTEVSNTCPEPEDTGGGDTDAGADDDLAQLTYDEATSTFTIAPVATEGEEMDITITCPLDGADFTCEPFVFEFDGAEFGMDFVSHIESTMSGSFSSNTSMDGQQVITQTCTGADCESSGLTNCETEATFNASLQE